MSLRKLQFQVFSDLHLEFFTKAFPKPKPLSPYLFLAGDIGHPDTVNFQNFLKYCNQNWSKTYYVFGNHDLWHKTKHVNQIKTELKQYINQNNLFNIKVLDNGEIDKLNDEIYIIGATFWTKGSEDAKIYLNDYNMIKIKDEPKSYLRPVEPNDFTKISYNEYNAIHSLLNYSDILASKYIIVLTHFPPFRTGTSHPKFNSEKGPVKEYFSWPNDTLSNLITNNVITWISGHTHYSYDFVCEHNVRLISNQMGYLKEAEKGDTKFNEDGLYDINYISLDCNEK
jgi:Calcineurin-like phosphoesterase